MHATTALFLGTMAEVRIDLGDRSYPILIGEGLLSQAASWAPVANRRASALVVTNETVAPLYAQVRWSRR